MERPKSVAKWGAACAPCSAAKAKCIRSNPAPGAKCDRCHRLSKDCASQVHRPRKKRTSKPSRTAQLEERLNGLVDLLKAQGDLSTLNVPESLSVAPTCIPNEGDPAVVRQFRPSSSTGTTPYEDEDEDEDVIFIPPNYNSYAPKSCICRPEPGEYPVPTDADDDLLEDYLKNMVPTFPFVVLARTSTPEKLRAEKPFLMRAIRMVASYRNARSMRAQMYRLIEHVSDHMIMGSARSLDLLQGIIVMVGWYHYHCMMHSQMNNLVHLAISMLADLGYNRHPQLAERTRLMKADAEEPSPRSNEERRALLGVWYLSSALAVDFVKIESMRYSNYIQHCLRELEEEKEYETDALLVHMVRLQHLTEKITHINSQDGVDEDIPGIPRAPVSAYVSAFQAELDRMRSSLNKNLRANRFLQVCINTAQLRLYEPPLIDAKLLDKFSRSLTALTHEGPSTLDYFYRAVHALTTWFNHWLSIPIVSYLHIPVSQCSQLIYAITMLSRWAKLTHAAPLSGMHGPSCMLSHTYQGQVTPAATATPSDTGSSSVTSIAAPLQNITLRENTDPAIPAAVAQLRSQIMAQPELKVDFAGTLAALSARFDSASREIIGPGTFENNIWDYSAKKMVLTRARLARWAELIGEGTVEREMESARFGQQVQGTHGGRAGGVGMGMGADGVAVSGGSGIIELGGGGTAMDGVVEGPMGYMNMLEQNTGHDMGWENLWGEQLFDGIDPVLWGSYYGESGNAVLQGAGNPL